MCQLPIDKDENLLVGIETSDDAAVYKINEELAIVQTVDFFTPVVDDPYVYGQIAAANALSDVYAMGADPLLAMNIVCFPEDLPREYVDKILRGGHDKVKEAGALLVGGHTVADDEPKYGLSVSGFINPKNLKKNSSAKPGDVLVLTKQIGTGIMNSAIKADMISDEGYKETVNVMLELNKIAKDAMVNANANSCTDITGFGLLGHAYEMAKGSDVSLVIETSRVPIIEEALELAKKGIVTGGGGKNYQYIKNQIEFRGDITESLLDCLNDPQTSGGLLISIKEANLSLLVKGLEKISTRYAVIGRVIEAEENRIILE